MRGDNDDDRDENDEDDDDDDEPKASIPTETAMQLCTIVLSQMLP